MKLFKYEGYQVTVSEEALMLKPFRDIWKNDKSKTKDKAMLQLAYVYFMCDPRSDYQYIIDEEERSKAILEGEGIKDDYYNDIFINEAMSFYDNFKSTSALLLEDTRVAIEKIRTFLKEVDLKEEDDKGKPKYTIQSITQTIKLIPQLIKDLDEAEKSIASEMRNSGGKVRGQKTKSLLEDNLDI